MKRFCSVAIAVLLPLAAHATTYTFSDTQDETSSVLDDLNHGTAYTWGITNSSTSSGVNTLTALENAIHSGSQKVSTVTLTLTGISDWTTEPDDVLYVDILNGLEAGSRSTDYDNSPLTDDTSYGSDPFDPYNDSNTATNYNELESTLSGNPSNPVTFIKPGSGSAALIQASSATSGWTPPSNDPGTFTAVNTTNTFTVTYTLSTANDALLASLLGSDASGGATAGDVLGLGLGPDCHFADTGISLTINTSASVPDNGATLALLGLALLGLAGYSRTLKRSVRA
ncbi:MAG: VPDSG-CTERM sorting domain-containing protein [Opitutaceae bacterium]|jgi:hypothetical protein